MHEELRGLKAATDGCQDAHEPAHANDIRRQFADRNVTTMEKRSTRAKPSVNSLS